MLAKKLKLKVGTWPTGRSLYVFVFPDFFSRCADETRLYLKQQDIQIMLGSSADWILASIPPQVPSKLCTEPPTESEFVDEYVLCNVLSAQASTNEAFADFCSLTYPQLKSGRGALLLPRLGCNPVYKPSESSFHFRLCNLKTLVSPKSNSTHTGQSHPEELMNDIEYVRNRSSSDPTSIRELHSHPNFRSPAIKRELRELALPPPYHQASARPCSSAGRPPKRQRTLKYAYACLSPGLSAKASSNAEARNNIAASIGIMEQQKALIEARLNAKSDSMRAATASWDKTSLPDLPRGKKGPPPPLNLKSHHHSEDEMPLAVQSAPLGTVSPSRSPNMLPPITNMLPSTPISSHLVPTGIEYSTSHRRGVYSNTRWRGQSYSRPEPLDNVTYCGYRALADNTQLPRLSQFARPLPLSPPSPPKSGEKSQSREAFVCRKKDEYMALCSKAFDIMMEAALCK